MDFQFPQFIKTKTKVIGPFTIGQFAYIAAGGMLIFLLQFLFSTTILIIVGIVIMGFAAALAFLQIDNVPLPRYILNAFAFIIGPKRYIFKKDENR